MACQNIDLTEWQSLDSDFVNETSLENAKRLNDLVKAKGDEEVFLADPASYLSLMQSMAESTD